VPVKNIPPTDNSKGELTDEHSLTEWIKSLQELELVAWNGEKLKPITPPVINSSDIQVSDILIEMRGNEPQFLKKKVNNKTPKV